MTTLGNFEIFNTVSEDSFNYFEFKSQGSRYRPVIINSNTTFDSFNNFVLLDTSSSSLTCNLLDGNIGDTMIISLLNRKGLSAIVNCSTGSFFLDPSTSTRNLIFTSKGWTQYGELETNSFFATTQQGNKLVGVPTTPFQSQGISTSLSADGKTLAIGAFGDDTDIGAVFIFTENNGTWSQQGNKLVGSGYIGTSGQGYSVALSADGNTLAFGGKNDDAGVGAVWIFVRNNGVWTQQGNKLVGSGYIGSPEQGVGIDISADGNTLAFGGFQDNAGVGAVWIFVRNNGVWTQQGNKIIGTGAIGNALQGFTISLSADGNTLASGGAFDNGAIGAVWVFVRLLGNWLQQQKLVGTNSAPGTRQGSSLALSSDGNTLAAGGLFDNGSAGAVWVFTRFGGILGGNNCWTQQGNKIVGSGAVGNAEQGTSVSLSSDGNTLAIGGRADDGGVGAVWFFVRSGNGWTQQGNKIVGSGAVGNAEQGTSVSLSSNGNTLAVGGFEDNGGIGATWVFI